MEGSVVAMEIVDPVDAVEIDVSVVAMVTEAVSVVAMATGESVWL